MIKGTVKKQQSKIRGLPLLGNLGSFYAKLQKITIPAEFWVQQTHRHKFSVFAVLKIR